MRRDKRVTSAGHPGDGGVLSVRARSLSRWNEITADDPASALVHFAKENQITQIVLGASSRSRWEKVTSRASVVQRVLRFARQADVDVHVIARHGKGAPLRVHETITRAM
jgi:K+-sensing histidine kinase KdpD